MFYSHSSPSLFRISNGANTLLYELRPVVDCLLADQEMEVHTKVDMAPNALSTILSMSLLPVSIG